MTDDQGEVHLFADEARRDQTLCGAALLPGMVLFPSVVLAEDAGFHVCGACVRRLAER